MPPKRRAAPVPAVDEDETQAPPEKKARGRKKTQKARGRNEDQNGTSSNSKVKEIPKPKSTPEKAVLPKEISQRPTRAAKTAAAHELKEESSPSPAQTAKKSKKTEKKAKTVAKDGKKDTKSALLNSTVTKWNDINFDCSKKNSKGKSYNLKITSWNVDGIRAWLKKDGLSIIQYDKPDIFCLQETKCSKDKLPQELLNIEGYKDYWCSSEKEGYAGVAVYTKIEPLNVSYGIGIDDHDEEGRCITLELDNFFLINVYVPNAGRGLVTLPKRLEWNKAFKDYVNSLNEKKAVVLCGDMNVAHNEMDLKNPKTNKKNAGFTPEEREGLSDFLACGYKDTFRELYPDVTDAYTFWSYMSQARSKNVGWRLDYFLISDKLMERVCDVVIKNEVFGSDHCPITMFIQV